MPSLGEMELIIVLVVFGLPALFFLGIFLAVRAGMKSGNKKKD